jgi:hypothetical protein
MTIENESVVDGLGLDPDTDEVVMLISDHLDWTDEARHFRCIEKKIGADLRFLQSGDISRSVPTAADKRICIEVVQQFDPTPGAREFLKLAADQLAESGVRLSCRLLPPS